MRKAVIATLVGTAALLLSACGHNIVQYSDGVGFDLGINPETYMLSMTLRYGKILSAVVRDNTEVDMSGKNETSLTAQAGSEKSVNPVSTTDGTVTIKVGKQVNGYLVDYVKAGGDPSIIFNKNAEPVVADVKDAAPAATTADAKK